MDRKKIFLLVKALIIEQIKVSQRLTKESQKEANYHKGAMASRYDTFKEEAQGRVAESEKREYELMQELKILSGFIRELDNSTLSNRVQILSNRVQMGSVVSVIRSNGEKKMYLVLPIGGGLRVQFEDKEFIVVTLKAPLCKKMFNKKVGDNFLVNVKKNEYSYEIIEIL